MGLIDQIIGVESGGDPTAKNPRSSASGLGQFIDSTWLAMLAKHRPDLAERSRDEQLALKADPAISRAMTEAYAKDNEAILSAAGLPVNPGTTYLAHFAGPQGAVKVLQSDPATPIDKVLDAKAVAANPFLKGMTAGDLAAWAAKKMGGAAPQPAPQVAPASPAIPLQAIPQMAAPMFQQQMMEPPPQISAMEIAQPPPIFAPPRKPINLRLNTFARPNGGFFIGKV